MNVSRRLKAPPHRRRIRLQSPIAHLRQEVLEAELEHSAGLIHAAAKKDAMKEIILELSRPLIQEHLPKILNMPYNNCPPLVLACRHNSIKVVNYLLTLIPRGLDIEQTGSVSFSKEDIQGAAPLWTAAACGHFDIAKGLIKAGANISHRTSSGSTPLRAACYDGHLNVVKVLRSHGSDINMPNKYGHTPLMIACYKQRDEIASYLIKCGADVNRQSELRGNTALHDAAEAGSVAIVEILLKAGAHWEVHLGDMSPMLSAAAVGQTNMVNYFRRHHHIKYSQEQYAEALELLGAAHIDRNRSVTAAIDCWLEALEIRLIINGDQFPAVQPNQAYLHVREMKSADGLLAAEPETLEMLALALRERILGISHPDTAYYIRHRGAMYADRGNFQRCMELWTYSLDIQIRGFEAGHDNIFLTAGSCGEVLNHMLVHQHCANGTYIREITELTYTEMQRCVAAQQPDKVFRLARIFMHLAGVWIKLIQSGDEGSSSSEDCQKLYELGCAVVALAPIGKAEETLLHLAVQPSTTKLLEYCESAYPFPCPEVTVFLLSCGAAVNAVDVNRRTPLHTALKHCNGPLSFSSVQRVIDVLIDGGVIANGRDVCGRTALKYAEDVGNAELVSVMRRHTGICLQDIAAAAVVDSGLNYYEELPLKLAQFVDMF
eukprot:m.944 g.944  ORF g.944 m.944 type:complete len:661 (+) comp5256_c0_seq1:131-2113(+)